jgi:hypothetical protein
MRLGLGIRSRWQRFQQSRALRAEAHAERSAHPLDFSTLRAYALFIGYPRSGHSLVGSLLDAHPRLVIAHEADALAWVQAGLTREEIFHLLIRNAREFTSGGREWTDYKYEVPGQFHGRWTELRVIGDKKGQGTVNKLQEDPDLLDQARRLFGLPIRLIHVLRNPFDNISTMAARESITLSAAADIYFALHDTVIHTRTSTPPEEWIDLRHEDVIRDPRASVRRLVEFLGETADPAYLDACASIVFPSPHQSRRKADWTPEAIASVQERIDARPLLAGYTYAGA